MQSLSFLIVLILLVARHVAAQHPLIGTWEMISVKGLDADGKPFYLDTTLARETKIITPTHYMLIAWDVDQDSLIFNRTMGGRVALEGAKYIEIPTVASVQIFENVKADFSWRLKENIFTQSGSIIRPDGKRVVLNALTFRRVTDAPPNADNPAIGTWRQIDEYYTTIDGKKIDAFRDTESCLLLITPTHWMRMELDKNAFSNVAYGTYHTSESRVRAETTFSTATAAQGALEFKQVLDGNKMELTFQGTTPEGEAVTFFHRYERSE